MLSCLQPTKTAQCEIHRAEASLQKPAEHEKQWLGGFNFIFKFKALLERLRRPDQLEEALGLAVRALPHPYRFGPKSRPKLLLIQRRELAKRVDSPLVQDR